MSVFVWNQAQDLSGRPTGNCSCGKSRRTPARIERDEDFEYDYSGQGAGAVRHLDENSEAPLGIPVMNFGEYEARDDEDSTEGVSLASTIVNNVRYVGGEEPGIGYPTINWGCDTPTVVNRSPQSRPPGQRGGEAPLGIPEYDWAAIALSQN